MKLLKVPTFTFERSISCEIDIMVRYCVDLQKKKIFNFSSFRLDLLWLG